jgi:cell fate (sporulation/competence/biofilm development) regulator YlbF (YheA/YmcA/DUF963 family)
VAKETEMTSNIAGVSITLLEETSNLAENLAQSEPFLRLKVAEQRLHADPQAMQLLSDLSALQQKIRKQQTTGAISQKDLTQLRALQSAVGTNETIQDHLLTQELAVAFLREVNQTISQQLGVDFATLARRSSGCC